MRWEYKKVMINDVDFKQLGMKGWELVTVTPDTQTHYGFAYFKRPKENDVESKKTIGNCEQKI